MEKFGPLTFVPGRNNGVYPYSHSLHIDADIRAVVDAGAGSEQTRALLDGPSVDVVMLTHFHEDHIISLGMFEDCRVWIAESEAPALQDLESFLDLYDPTEKERVVWRQLMTEAFNYRPRQVDRTFNSPETIDLGGVTVEIIPTPGHTVGHTSFYFPDQGVLFLGDYDLTAFGPYYGDRDACIDDVIESVNRLKQIPAKIWIASHEQGLFQTDPGEAWDRFLGVIDQRENKLIDLLANPCTVDDIVQARIIYRKAREPKEFFDYAERAIMSKHLDRLLAQGIVVQDGDVYRVV